MRKVTARLSDEVAGRLEHMSEKYDLKDLEEALRFSVCFTLKVLERLETRRTVVH